MITDKQNEVYIVSDETQTTKAITATGVVDIPVVIWNGSLEAVQAMLADSQEKVAKFQGIIESINSYDLANPEPEPEPELETKTEV